METKIILLLTIIAYSIIAGQPYMYIVALKNVQTDMGGGSYIQLRKLLDANFRSNYQYAVYTALITSLLLVLINIKSPNSLLFIAACISFIALITDLLLMMKGNMPINNLINTWTPVHYPDNWAEYRAKWLQIFFYREIATITGFISLVVGAVFGMR
jgi:uncharacterized membrane protein